MNRRIPINDLTRHAVAVRSHVGPAVDRVIDSGWYVLGTECSRFEEEFASYCGVTHCVGVANGTDALELGLRALGIGVGGRVATVANAGFYTTTALLAVGATPVFIDVDENTHLMDLSQLAQLVDAGSVDAVVITHLYGLMHDMEAVLRVAKPAGLAVLEDCAQAHGARRKHRRAGSSADVSTFSFYPTKNLGAVGDGGAVVTADAEIAARLRLLRQYGWEAKYRAVVRGARNSRLDELQAAVLRVKLPYLDAWNARRRDIASRLSSGISHPRVATPVFSEEEYVGHLYVVTCNDREELRRYLSAEGIQCDIHYPIPDHLQPSIVDVESSKVALPITEQLASRVLSLPCFPELSDEEVDYIVERINAW